MRTGTRARKPVTEARRSARLWSGSLAVPADFVGIHFHRWPNGSPVSLTPGFRFGMTRSHDYGPSGGSLGVGGVNWNSINTSNGVYNFGYLDEWVNTHFNAGRSLVYTLYGTPSWATGSSVLDPYGAPGGSSNPTSLTSVSDFVTTLITRYNSGAQKRIKALEIWNEPSFDATGYWLGTADQLAAIARTARLAAEAVDPSIITFSPGFASVSTVAPFMNAGDGSGGFGRDHVKGFSVHPYSRYGWWDPIYGWGNNVAMGLQDFRNAATAAGLSGGIPMYVTEIGYTPNPGDPVLARLKPANFADWITRVSLASAAAGCRMICFYSYDGVLCGDVSANPRIGEAVTRLHDNISGRTITAIDLLTDGALRVDTSLGVVFF